MEKYSDDIANKLMIDVLKKIRIKLFIDIAGKPVAVIIQ